MKLGYVILYVGDVAESMSFYERAFGLERKFVAEEGGYGELNTGDTTLSLLSHAQAEQVLPVTFRKNLPDEPPAGMEVALVTGDVAAAFQRAVGAGAVGVSQPAEKPWGQTVAYVRDPNGILIELCTPIGG